jgi:hypothetical protein
VGDVGFHRRSVIRLGAAETGIGLGFRAAATDSITLVGRVRYFISNIAVYTNAIYAENFTEISFGPSFYVNDRFSIDANLSKNIGQYDDFRYSLSATFHF